MKNEIDLWLYNNNTNKAKTLPTFFFSLTLVNTSKLFGYNFDVFTNVNTSKLFGYNFELDFSKNRPILSALFMPALISAIFELVA